MSRQISQETFNEAVLENMELLDLSIEESIKETVSQFESQGVRLLGIITDPDYHKDDERKDPVLELKTKLLEKQDMESRVQLLAELRTLLSKDVAYKVSSGNHGLYEVLISILESDSLQPNVRDEILLTLLQLLDGYPDLLDDRGVTFLLRLLEEGPEEAAFALKLIRVSCVKHEINRERFIAGSISRKLGGMAARSHDPQLLRLLTRTARALVLDDDIRSEIPSSYPHALLLSADLVQPLVYHLKVTHDLATQGEILEALTSLIVNHSICEDVERDGGLPAAIKALSDSFNSQDKILRVKLATNCFKFFVSLAGNDEVKHKLMEFELPQLMHKALVEYRSFRDLVHSALLLISKISLRSPQYGQLLFKMNYAEPIIQAFNNFPKDYSLLILGCWCIRNMSARNPEFHVLFLQLGAEEILRRLAGLDRNVSYDAKIALRELGCEVEAREPWTGEKGDKLAAAQV